MHRHALTHAHQLDLHQHMAQITSWLLLVVMLKEIFGMDLKAASKPELNEERQRVSEFWSVV